MPLLQKRIENAEETHEWTLSTIKSLGILMQIIVKSKRCSDRYYNFFLQANSHYRN